MPVFSWARGCLLLPPAPTGDAWVLGSKQECIPVSLSSKLRTSPSIVRFPLRYAWFWIPFVFIMIPTGSIATMLFLASGAAGTPYERWVHRRFTWLVTAFAAVFIAIEVVAIAWPLVASRHAR